MMKTHDLPHIENSIPNLCKIHILNMYKRFNDIYHMLRYKITLNQFLMTEIFQIMFSNES